VALVVGTVVLVVFGFWLGFVFVLLGVLVIRFWFCLVVVWFVWLSFDAVRRFGGLCLFM